MSPEQRLDYGTREGRTLPSRGISDTTSLAVLGLEETGLPFAIAAATRGFLVRAFDTDEVKVAQLEQRDAVFLEEEEVAQFKNAKTLWMTTMERDIKGLASYIISVATSVDREGVIDLATLKNACRTVGAAMSAGALVVVESSVNPGTCEEVCLPILEKESGLSRHQFYFAYCPARPAGGSSEWRVANTPRVVGALNRKSLDRALALYRAVIDAKVHPMRTLKEAEAVNLVENAFRDVNLAFVNELAMAFAEARIDTMNVIRGASTKPFGFLPHYPSAGVGGDSLPANPYILLSRGHQKDFEHRFITAAHKINSAMPFYAVRTLIEALRERRKSVRGAIITLLGLSHTAESSDMRNSPALVMIQALKQKGARVRTYDPHIPHASTMRSLGEALRGADAALIATDHIEFCTLPPKIFEEYGVPIVVDGKNCLDKDAFLDSPVKYRGIGR